MTDAQKNHAYEMTGAKKIDAFEMTDAQKNHEYEMTGAKSYASIFCAPVISYS